MERSTVPGMGAVLHSAGTTFRVWAPQQRGPPTLSAGYLISEDLRNHAATTDSPEAGGAGFHAQWDASFVHPVRAAVISPEPTEKPACRKILTAQMHKAGSPANAQHWQPPW